MKPQLLEQGSIPPVLTSPKAPTAAMATRGYRWYVVAVLFLVGVFNLMDRQILSILLEPIKRELGVSDTAMGMLTGFAFVSFYTLASVPIARVADSYSRRDIIAIALAFWSAMTTLSGLVTSFVQLALARIGVGVGEAATGPAGQSMLSDLFPPERRTAALSALAVSVPVGFMVSFMAGGWLNEAVGWRMTLMYVGLPGLLLGLLVRLTLREPLRGGAEHEAVDATHYDLRSTLAYLWSLRSLRYLTLGAAMNVFTAWALMVWSSAFLIRVHGMETREVGAWLGLASGVGGATGTFLWGLVAQRLARRDPRWLLGVPSLTSLLTVPFIVLFLSLPAASAALPMFFGIMLFGPAMIGPITTVTQGLAKVRMRALAAALVTLTFNLIGVGLGPLTVGVISDLLRPALGVSSIRYALLPAASIAMLGGALHFALGARHLRADLERAAA